MGMVMVMMDQKRRVSSQTTEHRGKQKKYITSLTQQHTFAGEQLHQISTRVAPRDTVTFMNDDIGIHDIHSTDRTVTIHLYIPGYTEVYSMVPTQADTVHLVQTKYQAVLKGKHMQLSPEFFRVVSVD